MVVDPPDPDGSCPRGPISLAPQASTSLHQIADVPLAEVSQHIASDVSSDSVEVYLLVPDELASSDRGVSNRTTDDLAPVEHDASCYLPSSAEDLVAPLDPSIYSIADESQCPSRAVCIDLNATFVVDEPTSDPRPSVDLPDSFWAESVVLVEEVPDDRLDFLSDYKPTTFQKFWTARFVEADDIEELERLIAAFTEEVFKPPRK